MRKLAMVTVIGLVVGLAGCAAGGSNRAVTKNSAVDDEIDWAKMTLISNDAARRGYRVVWVHAPQKPKSGPERGAP